jgi:hypothetical protein
VPAIVNASVTPGGVLTFYDFTLCNAQQNADLVSIYDNGQSTNGNIEVQASDGQSGAMTNLDKITSNIHIWKVNFMAWSPAGYSPAVFYVMQHPMTAGEYREIDCTMPLGNDTFYALVLGLGQNAGLHINVAGSQYSRGPDTFHAVLAGTLQTGSDLGISFSGGGGFNDIYVDAYTYSPTIQPGATLWMNLSGDGYGNTNVVNASNVGFDYRGLMDGNIRFNIWGGSAIVPSWNGNDVSTREWLYARMWFATGSYGYIGDSNMSNPSADFIQAGGNDDIDFEMYGDTGVWAYNPMASGGATYAGYNSLYYTPRMYYMGFSMSGFQNVYWV